MIPLDALGMLVGHLVGDFMLQSDGMASEKTSNSVVCAVHVAIYTALVALFTAAWISAAGLAVIALTHFAIDRWRLARVWMDWMGQPQFARGGLAPWSVIVIDQIMHLWVLYAVAAVHWQVG